MIDNTTKAYIYAKDLPVETISAKIDDIDARIVAIQILLEAMLSENNLIL